MQGQQAYSSQELFLKNTAKLKIQDSLLKILRNQSNKQHMLRTLQRFQPKLKDPTEKKKIDTINFLNTHLKQLEQQQSLIKQGFEQKSKKLSKRISNFFDQKSQENSSKIEAKRKMQQRIKNKQQILKNKISQTCDLNYQKLLVKIKRSKSIKKKIIRARSESKLNFSSRFQQVSLEDIKFRDSIVNNLVNKFEKSMLRERAMEVIRIKAQLFNKQNFQKTEQTKNRKIKLQREYIQSAKICHQSRTDRFNSTLQQIKKQQTQLIQDRKQNRQAYRQRVIINSKLLRKSIQQRSLILNAHFREKRDRIDKFENKVNQPLNKFPLQQTKRISQEIERLLLLMEHSQSDQYQKQSQRVLKLAQQILKPDDLLIKILKLPKNQTPTMLKPYLKYLYKTKQTI